METRYRGRRAQEGMQRLRKRPWRRGSGGGGRVISRTPRVLFLSRFGDRGDDGGGGGDDLSPAAPIGSLIPALVTSLGALSDARGWERGRDNAGENRPLALGLSGTSYDTPSRRKDDATTIIGSLDSRAMDAVERKHRSALQEMEFRNEQFTSSLAFVFPCPCPLAVPGSCNGQRLLRTRRHAAAGRVRATLWLARWRIRLGKFLGECPRAASLLIYESPRNPGGGPLPSSIGFASMTRGGRRVGKALVFEEKPGRSA